MAQSTSEPAQPASPDVQVTEADLMNPDIPPLADGSPFVGPLVTIDKQAEALAVQRFAAKCRNKL
ncbi:MAG: hypothetical protein R2932_25115 [Caldilineaceae bacterium]